MQRHDLRAATSSTIGRRSLRERFTSPFLLAIAAFVLSIAACGGDDAALAPVGPPVTTASGVVMQDLRLGAGSELVDGRYFAVHYDARIAAIAGGPGEPTPYDSTRSVEPFVAKLGAAQLLAGFADGVRGMKQGGRRRFTIPPAAAHGTFGKGRVPPDASLEYDVELIGVFTTTSSGLQYRVLEEGAGNPAHDGQLVALEHRAWLLETGRQLSSSVGTGQPLTFIVGHGDAVPGLDEAVRLMKPGARFQLALPAKLAYGEQGHGFSLLPGEEVLFDVRLLRVRDP